MTDTPSARDAGQAPTSEQPQAGQQTSSATSETPQAGGSSTLSAEDYQRQIAELRKENASHRTKLSAYEKAQAAADEAKLSELEKANKAKAEAEATLTDRTRAYQERLIRAEIRANAASIGVVDPDAVVKLLDWSQFEFDDEGVPTNTDKLIAKLLADKPYLLASQAGATRPAARSGGATNPGAQARMGAFSKEQIRAMSPGEYQANRNAIMEQLKKNRDR